MTLEQAIEAVKFIKTIKNNSTVHIHCMHGFSRSVAFSIFIHRYFGLNLDNNLSSDNNYNKHVLKMLESVNE